LRENPAAELTLTPALEAGGGETPRWKTLWEERSVTVCGYCMYENVEGRKICRICSSFISNDADWNHRAAATAQQRVATAFGWKFKWVTRGHVAKCYGESQRARKYRRRALGKGFASIAARFRGDPLFREDMAALGRDEENMKMYDLWAEERAEAMTLTRDQRIEKGFGHWHMSTDQTGGRGTISRS